MRSVNGNLYKWRIAFLKHRNPPIVRSLGYRAIAHFAGVFCADQLSFRACYKVNKMLRLPFCHTLHGIRFGGQADTELRKMKVVEWCVPYFLHHQVFSTGFTSVHGERPSAEYARLRKESLENEFGHALGTYSSSSFSAYYRFGPFLALYRATIISFQVAKLTLWHFFLKDIRQRAIKFRETLIRLGPFYVKAIGCLGQALSTRPDILPKVYCQELAKLQDQIPPFPTRTAIKSIELQLGAPISQIFADISPEPIAAASLGQVYKATLHSGELVAVKVQRPGMSLRLTLDALLFHMIGGQLKRFAKAQKDLLVAVNEMVRHMFEEIDYVLEGQNAERFDSLYGRLTEFGHGQEKETTESVARKKNANYVKVPKIYWNLTRKAVLTMEWIDGIKLTDADRLKKASLNRVKLIDQGLYCSLRQLLEVGFFHADPHPGNLVATEDGFLAYFDFGMMGDIPRHYRVGLIQMLVHFVNLDSWALANDFLSLGFIPDGVDLPSVSDALQASFGRGNRQSQDFQSIMNQLYDIMYEFNFSLPPDYALVVRALGSLEGTAKALDPDFKVVESAYPFVIGRLLADPSADMRKILRQLLIRNNGSIRWNRLERLVAAISEEVSESAEEPVSNYEANRSSLGSKSFDMDSVVAATEDLLHFILSEKGWRVRVFLVQDIVKASDLFLQEEIFDGIVNKKAEVEGKNQVEGHATFVRVVKGLQSLQQAVRSAPEAWTGMLIRLVIKPEVHRFAADIICALATHLGHKLSENSWYCMSKFLHKLAENDDNIDS
ncbi:hypothetical protein Syun_024868 [Stephania yunnanensis]|uniref:ABC1 atypical kinase-like domain-containing protein n=1 Tax=Stephania yunnanensis TaxID=152371 RepID=A0AAP0EXP1_9MAGN